MPTDNSLKIGIGTMWLGGAYPNPANGGVRVTQAGDTRTTISGNTRICVKA